MAEEKLKLTKKSENNDFANFVFYKYGEFDVIQNKTVPSGYWGRWECSGYFTSTWRDLKKHLDKFIYAEIDTENEA